MRPQYQASTMKFPFNRSSFFEGSSTASSQSFESVKLHGKEIASEQHINEQKHKCHPSTDVEAQFDHGEKCDVPGLDDGVTTPSPAENAATVQAKYFHLAMYFVFNFALTIYNKFVLGKFAFPWLLTFLHAVSASIGCYLLMLRGVFTLKTLTGVEKFTLLAFSFLFTVNIAMSNVSLEMVSVPFHQVIRATCPIFTILIYRVYYHRFYTFKVYLSIVPIISGVALATYGDYYFTTRSFFLTLLGVLLAAVKTVATNRMIAGNLDLAPMEILLRMSPLAAIQCLGFAFTSGEIGKMMKYANEGNFTYSSVTALAGNGLLAFLLNISSFQTNRLTGALTMAICANVKQVMTILVGTLVFDVRIGPANAIGMLLALAGAGWYSKIELSSRRT